MDQFKYSDEELKINKVLKMNQEQSKALLNNPEMEQARDSAGQSIETSLALLKRLGKDGAVAKLEAQIQSEQKKSKLEHRPQVEDWDKIIQEAEMYYPDFVGLEDIMSADEMDASLRELDEINEQFSKKTSIINQTDLSFLAIATALKVTKSLVFPYIAQSFHYGKGFDPAERLAHNDPNIEQAHKEANKKFRDEKLQAHKPGHWINFLYQTPPYDITTGSADLGIYMGGRYHRMYTLGHDPILGWIFGTMNILTDIITLNNFHSYRVDRKPKMRITGESVPIGVMVHESYKWVTADYLNLPAAIFAQAQHFKSDEYTKIGLPVPLLSSINGNFASELYKSNYDALCSARDAKIVGASFVVSRLFDMVISLAHGLFCTENEAKNLYEVRTRKILLISDSIASSSTIIKTAITANPKDLDIGGLLNTVIHLFTDFRFMAKVKKEFIKSDISNRLQSELEEVENLYANI